MSQSVKAPVFVYLTTCCGERGEKEPCRRTQEEKKEGKWGEHSLGTWRCSGCGNQAKVERRRKEVK